MTSLFKRKHSDSNGSARKKFANVESESNDEYSDSSDAYIEDAPLFETQPVWKDTITKVVKCVVSIQFLHPISFDTELAIISEATGFIVDKDRGLILTNRHVVGPGPFYGHAVFDNHEEAVVKPIYRDPIHDFGFLKFDPNEVKYMDLSQLELKPEDAHVGTEIRVVGNDAGEKLSILSGFISRLDRNAPEYGSLSYNDFNTEYIQAAASASGGSSGSPVVNERGDAVALQAGGNVEASTDFFLPLFRPLRALRCIQEKLPITRGDIQVEWRLRPYNECKRLGLTPEAESRARQLFPDKIGMLVAELALPEGPADGLILEGDTLVSIDDQPISTFIQVDEILDANVGKELKFVVERGGEEITQTIKVGDLHKITPDRFVSVAGCIFNPLSYQIARCFCLPVKGVFVNYGSRCFTMDRTAAVIDSIDDKPTPDLESFVEVMKSIPDRSRVGVSYRYVLEAQTEQVKVMYLERRWDSSLKIAKRNDETGLWDFKTLQEKPLNPVLPLPRFAKFVDIPIEDKSFSGCSKISSSIVLVTLLTTLSLDGYPYKTETGNGVVVDATNGYVLVSRKIVPHDFCDISVTFAESFDIRGEVVFLHPNQNYAIVKYDPKLVNSGVLSPKFSTEPLKREEKIFFIGLDQDQRLITEETKVSSIALENIPINDLPRYRGSNIQCVLLDSSLALKCPSGVICDKDGTVRAFWLSFLGETTRDEFSTYYMGLDVTEVNPLIESLKENIIPKSLRIIDAEFNTYKMIQVRSRGLTEEWITKFEDACEDEIKILSVDRIGCPPKDAQPNPLKVGDIVLAINGKICTKMSDLQVMYNTDEVDFKILREKQVIDLKVPTLDTEKLETNRAVHWCGILLQTPHHAVRQSIKDIPSEIFVSYRWSGSPALQYGIPMCSFVTHVNGIETKDLETFIKVVKDIPDLTYVKMRLILFDQVPLAVSIKTNYHYFESFELRKIDGEWKSIDF